MYGRDYYFQFYNYQLLLLAATTATATAASPIKTSNIEAINRILGQIL